MRFLSANFKVQATALGTALALSGSNQNSLPGDTTQSGARPSFAKAAHMSRHPFTRSHPAPAYSHRFQTNGAAGIIG